VLEEIVLSVCMLIAPAHCKDVHLQVASELGASLLVPFNCMRQGQIEGQKWIAAHPGWQIVRWRCSPTSRKRSDV
jgi:hypothetical protein